MKNVKQALDHSDARHEKGTALPSKLNDFTNATIKKRGKNFIANDILRRRHRGLPAGELEELHRQNAPPVTRISPEEYLKDRGIDHEPEVEIKEGTIFTNENGEMFKVHSVLIQGNGLDYAFYRSCDEKLFYGEANFSEFEDGKRFKIIDT